MNHRKKFAAATRLGLLFLLLLALAALAASPAAAQKKKKNTPPPADNSLTLPLPDEQQVDYVIGEMLGAWQLNDVEKLHKDYADDVIVVNGIYAPLSAGPISSPPTSSSARTCSACAWIAPTPMSKWTATPRGPAISGISPHSWMTRCPAHSVRQPWCYRSATATGLSCSTTLRWCPLRRRRKPQRQPTHQPATRQPRTQAHQAHNHILFAEPQVAGEGVY